PGRRLKTKRLLAVGGAVAKVEFAVVPKMVVFVARAVLEHLVNGQRADIADLQVSVAHVLHAGVEFQESPPTRSTDTPLLDRARIGGHVAIDDSVVRQSLPHD